MASAAPDGGPVSFGNALPGIRKLDRNVLAGREKAAVERDMRRERARGRGVGKEGQDIYDALSRTYVLSFSPRLKTNDSLVPGTSSAKRVLEVSQLMTLVSFS